MIATVAQSDATVIIYGESGTGKELVARAIHNQSPRRYFPLISVNSGALPESLVESELFGHERGAFTGAQYRRKGKLELADGGTLFLDEIATISEKTQVDLLRVLETHEFTRLGGTKPIHSDFRVICATNRNLKHLVDEGKFREDLYYRLNVITIHLPPLRERQDDIPLLANYFLRKYAISMGKKIQSIEPDAMALLQSYQWPGNVRELENIMERALVVGSPPAVRVRDLHISCEKTGPLRIMRPLEEVEKEHIVAVLDETGWNISRSAVILGIDRATLYNKIRKFGLKQ
jgi:transcriptional regulator with PAS, ATPase and Fis domain